MDQLQHLVRSMSTETKLTILGTFCLLIGIIGLVLYLPASEMGNAAGSGGMTVLGLALLWFALRRRAAAEDPRLSPGSSAGSPPPRR